MQIERDNLDNQGSYYDEFQVLSVGQETGERDGQPYDSEIHEPKLQLCKLQAVQEGVGEGWNEKVGETEYHHGHESIQLHEVEGTHLECNDMCKGGKQQ